MWFSSVGSHMRQQSNTEVTPNGVTTIASHRNAFAAGHAGKQQFIFFPTKPLRVLREKGTGGRYACRRGKEGVNRRP